MLREKSKNLNETVWCTLAPSKIHGIGVFAIRDIPKGQKVYCHEGKERLLYEDIETLLPEIKHIVLQRYPIALDGYPYRSPNDDVHLVSFINHSDNPNYNEETDKTIREIKKGEELTEDYGRYKKIINIV